MQIPVSASGPSDVDRAWQRYIHPAQWPDWSPQIKSVESTDEVIRTGTTGTVHGYLGLSVNFTVLGVDGDTHSWSWRVQAPLGVRLTLHHRLQRILGGTRTTLLIDGFAPVVLGYAPLAIIALRRLVAT
jgi:hypothetical protein